MHTRITIYTPSIDLNGNPEVKAKLDKRILRALNGQGAFQSKIINAENIGKTSDELVTMWNEAHPDDPVT